MTGIELITKERLKQLAYYPNDSNYKNNELMVLANILLSPRNLNTTIHNIHFLLNKGFKKDYIEKLCSKPIEDKLIIAAALCAAQIDLIQNKD